jgi:hypothetical protein
MKAVLAKLRFAASGLSLAMIAYSCAWSGPKDPAWPRDCGPASVEDLKLPFGAEWHEISPISFGDERQKATLSCLRSIADYCTSGACPGGREPAIPKTACATPLPTISCDRYSGYMFNCHSGRTSTRAMLFLYDGSGGSPVAAIEVLVTPDNDEPRNSLYIRRERCVAGPASLALPDHCWDVRFCPTPPVPGNYL